MEDEYEILLEVKPGFVAAEHLHEKTTHKDETKGIENNDFTSLKIELIKEEKGTKTIKTENKPGHGKQMIKVRSKLIKKESDVSEDLETEDKPPIRKSRRPTADCEFCGKTFQNKTILKGHIIAIHEKLKPFICTICNAAYGHERSLYRHKLTHTDIKPYLCQDCGTSFRDISHYYRHRDIHLNNKNYYCDVCGISFRRQHHLNQHMQRHTGVKPLQCPVCHYRCRQSTQLSNHIKRHHTHEFEYSCEFCDRKCVTRSELTVHTNSCKGKGEKIIQRVIPVNMHRQPPLSTELAIKHVEVETEGSEEDSIDPQNMDVELIIDEEDLQENDSVVRNYVVLNNDNEVATKYEIVAIKEGNTSDVNSF